MSKKDLYPELRQALAALTPRKSVNKQAVEDHIDIIEEKLKERVPIEEIAKVFRALRFDVPTSTLRQYIRDIRQARAKAQDNSKPTAAPPKSDRKLARQRKADDTVAQNVGHPLQASAGMPSTEAEPFDLALAPEPELVSDEGERLF